MTVKELIKKLKKIPGNVEVYIEADHGQTPEKASSIFVTTETELSYYGDGIDWMNMEDMNLKKITAVNIGY
jgi:hypothetical protein